MSRRRNTHPVILAGGFRVLFVQVIGTMSALCYRDLSKGTGVHYVSNSLRYLKNKSLYHYVLVVPVILLLTALSLKENINETYINSS